MKVLLVARARALGFDACRVTTAAPPASGPRLRQWLAEGKHGAMAYLERNAAKRIDPALVLAGARSVLTLAVSYGAGSSVSPPGTTGGVIARYARHADYHDALAAPLQELTAHVNQLGGEGTRSLWYVDTGPLLERDLAQRAGLGFWANTPTSSAANWATGFFSRKSSPRWNCRRTRRRAIIAAPAPAASPRAPRKPSPRPSNWTRAAVCPT